MNKYYIPSIEDIHVGYKCELEENGKWYPHIITGYDSENNLIQTDTVSFYYNNNLRTPYLTREQIEKEGWVEDTDHPSLKGLLRMKTDRATYWVRMIDKTNIRITRYTKPDHNNVWEMQQRSIVYDGNCPSINEFRKINKLLGIVK